MGSDRGLRPDSTSEHVEAHANLFFFLYFTKHIPVSFFLDLFVPFSFSLRQ